MPLGQDINENKLIEKFGEENWWFSRKKQMVLDAVEGDRILDLGCGPGLIGIELLKQNKKVVFLDRDSNALENIKRKYKDALTICSDAIGIRFTNAFDTCICTHLLEHIDDDVKLLKKINGALKSSGLLILDVPAIKLLYGPHDRELGHIRRYSKVDLEGKLKLSGFIIEESKYWNFISLFPKLLFRLLNKSGTQTNWFLTETKINSILKKILLFESHFPIGIGCNLFIKARKITKND